MRNTLLLTFMLFSSVTLKAQKYSPERTFKFNLQECLEYAYENQDSLKNAKLDIEKANYAVKETIGRGLPQLSASADFQDFLKIPTTLLPGEFFDEPGTFKPVKFGVKYQSSAGVSISQLLFSGSYIVALKGAKTYKELSVRSFNRTKIATNVAVSKAYYQVLVSNEQLRLLNANVTQLGQQVKETTELNKQGFAEKIDLDRIRVLYNNLLTTRENTERLLVLSNQLLKFQIGMTVTDSLQVKDKIVDVVFDSNTSIEVDTTAYRNRIEYGLLETQRKLNDLNLQNLKSEYLPSLSAFGSSSYQYQANRFGDLFDNKYPNTVVGLQLNIPIFNGFQRKYRVKQAQVELQKLDNTLNNVRNGILLQQEQARITYQNGVKSLKNQQANMELAREVLRVSKIKYQEGVGSSIEVTQAQTELEQSENNYIQALYDALISKVDLENAYGRIH
ncbi:TolC family protein [Arcticibacter eurypsychrophilus]|uniref:TolC family protein n=1 Tax=Arcticibacter eurypsychrophilus TaxID=1434752 RepID=UPI00084D4A0B|nr:TolC family protein [Arcticibacter eurypsychrophilus]